METENKKWSKSIFTTIKNIFIIIILLQFVPSAISNIKKYYNKAVTPTTYVGKLNIKGVISDSTFYVKKIKSFLKDPEIKALLVKIECPGGTPGSSQAIYEELKKFKKEKPVVVLVENLCASGAYYVASAADQIISPASALIGSIGVYLQVPNVKELLDKWNIKFKFIQSGKFKTTGNPLKELTGEEESYLQELADQNYTQFVADVANSRNLDAKNSNIWANGQIFIATKAKELKLIDKIGTLTDAENAIKELAKIDTEIKFITPKRQTGLIRMFTADDENGDDDSDFASKSANFLHAVYSNLMNKQNNLIS
ncbi:signal peptide peptidase SppA [Candidatus Dependentiae bacterium]|nr:signal peptide peptidase SppA [Candidatus Dependentiae bacterium]MBU4387339.1 signal peptide peptidase SppA [Candidatus Dependentiae bacterium]MCG2756196.1 signal peptide peptidase SppA [Candidatus Dependentiae bacterium]